MDMPKILVVDDEEDLCEILKFNLEIEGYEVDTAFSAEEALKMDIASYQLLLLDVMMGEISGFKMASILRKEEKTADIPIIFLTAKDTENDMLTGFNLGADDYISKPLLHPPGGGTRESRVAPYIRQGESTGKRMPQIRTPITRHEAYQSLCRWAGSPAHQKGIRDTETPPRKQRKCVLTRGNPFPDMERRSICA